MNRHKGSIVDVNCQNRCESTSSQTSESSGDICRICHCESDTNNPLLTPCYCSGSLKYVHQTCLQQWLTASETNYCELCKFPFVMHSKIKPFSEWRSLDMSGVERRRLCCAVLFHCAAALCVVWSLCVLIERATEEVKRGLIGWPFWTKLAVVTVGLTGGLVFMYIQCRQYLHLCHRWRARNRILLIQNAPEKVNTSAATNALTAAPMPSSGSSNNNDAFSCSFMMPNLQSPKHCRNYHPQIQVSANARNVTQHLERDWTLDDVSQISIFLPCAQSSGSMTPVYDSFQNAPISQSSGLSFRDSRPPIDENADYKIHRDGSPKEFTSNFEVPSNTKYLNSPLFMENRDILDVIENSKVLYRHSIVSTPHDTSDDLDKLLIEDHRRFSDTKLVNYEKSCPIFKLTLNGNSTRKHGNLTRKQAAGVLKFSNHDENHILTKDQKLIHSLSSAGMGIKSETKSGFERSRLFFKSLPNLNSSSETLIKM